MGVRGLARLVGRYESHVSLRMDLSAADANGRKGLVIDGSSLMYYLEDRYRSSTQVALTSISGGSCHAFAAVARAFIASLVAAQIPIWVVFDGIQAQRKRSTRILRRQSALSSTRLIESALTTYFTNVPHDTEHLKEVRFARLRTADLSKAVLKEVLNDFGIPVSAAISEADDECARLCDEVHALGILGEDSDYFIFNQNGGYIPLSSLIIEDDGSVYGRLFRVGAIAKLFAVPVSFLPVIACLGGNDIIVESLPELQRLHQTLRGRSNSSSVLEQILAAARAFHERCPQESEMDFLKHFIQRAIVDRSTAQRLVNVIEAEGVPKYHKCQRLEPKSALLKLHCSAKLCSNFALDVLVNRCISAQFGIGYSSEEDIRFVSTSLLGLRRRLCFLTMQNVSESWSISEVGLGVDFDLVPIANSTETPADCPVLPGSADSIFDQCQNGIVSVATRTELLKFVLFGCDEHRLWRSDSIFMNAIRYLIASCDQAESVAAALVRMYEAIQAGPDRPSRNASLAPIIHTHTLRLCAVFRHALLLSESANALLGWPLPSPRLQSCFEGSEFHMQYSSCR